MNMRNLNYLSYVLSRIRELENSVFCLYSSLDKRNIFSDSLILEKEKKL